MAKFVFRMEQLLKLKQQLENSKKGELAAAIKTVEKEKEKLKMLETQKIGYIDDIKKSMLKGISVYRLREFSNFIGSFEVKINNQKKIVNDAKVVADNIREQLIEITKQKKMLETLKQKKYEEFKIAEQRKEELAAGEIASYKYIKHKAGEQNGNHRTSKE